MCLPLSQKTLVAFISVTVASLLCMASSEQAKHNVATLLSSGRESHSDVTHIQLLERVSNIQQRLQSQYRHSKDFEMCSQPSQHCPVNTAFVSTFERNKLSFIDECMNNRTARGTPKRLQSSPHTFLTGKSHKQAAQSFTAIPWTQSGYLVAIIQYFWKYL